MNVCLVSREYPPDTGWGGIGTYVHHLAHGLAAQGHRVHVLAQGLTRSAESQDGPVTVHRILHTRVFSKGGRLREWGLRAEYSYHVGRLLARLVPQAGIDIVEAQNFTGEGLAYSFRKRTPLVTRLHTHFSETVGLSG